MGKEGVAELASVAGKPLVGGPRVRYRYHQEERTQQQEAESMAQGEAGKFGGASDIEIRIFEVKMNDHEELSEDF